MDDLGGFTTATYPTLCLRKKDRWLNKLLVGYGWYRRLSKDDRRLPTCSQPAIYIFLIRLIALVSEEYNQEKLLKPNCRKWIKSVLLDLPLIVSMNVAVIIEICFQMLEVLRHLSIYI